MYNVMVISSLYPDKYNEFETLPKAMRYVRGWRNRLELTLDKGGSFTIYLANQNDDILGCWEASWTDRRLNW